jgi:hypothetical protein
MFNVTPDLATVPLDTLGGLVAGAPPESLPEGASPRTYDTDYLIGQTKTRAGLQSQFTFADSAVIKPGGNAVDTSLGGAAWANPSNVLTNANAFAIANIVPNFSVLSVTIQNPGLYHYGQIINVTFSGPGAGGATGTVQTTSGVPGGTVTITGVTVTNPGSYTGPITVAFSAGFGPGGTATGTVVASETGSFTDALDITQFGFTLPSSDTPQGFTIAIIASATASCSLSVQMLKAGVPVGEVVPMTPSLSTPTTLVFGSADDLFDEPWLYSDINATNFGVRITATSNAAVTVSVGYTTLAVQVLPSQENFTWIGGELLLNGQVLNIACDANGNLWLENATINPTQLSLLRTGIALGSHGFGVAANNALWMALSDLTQGIDIPLQYRNGWMDRISQVGPGAPPSFSGNVNPGNIADITAYSYSGGILTLTAVNTFTAGVVVTINAGGGDPLFPLNGQSFNVLGTGLSGTQFEIAETTVTGSGSSTATAVPQYTYNLVASPNGVTQNPVQPFTESGGAQNSFDDILWSSGPGSTNAGNVVTIYYIDDYHFPNAQDQTLINLMNNGQTVYVYVSGTNLAIANGTFQITGYGKGYPPGAGSSRYYFTFTVNQSGYQNLGGGSGAQPGNYQLTVATATTILPVPGLTVGNQITLSGVGVTSWNATWTVTYTPNSGTYAILQTSLLAGTATYQWALDSGVAPSVGELVTVTGTLNGNGIFNVTDAVIASVTGTTAGTFTITGFPNQTITAQAEQGLAEAAGTQFEFDPGELTLGSGQNPIYGNSGGGYLTVVGGSGQVIGTGTRQAVVGFITRNGYWTAPSPFTTFTTSENANYIFATNIPLGPPNTVARYIAFTEAGQEGVAGDFYFVIPQPVSFQVFNTVFLSSATVIYDNVTTSAQFTFTDAVLLDSLSIDSQGNNLFNLIEIGNPASIALYDTRLWYFLCQNKIQNFLNMSFDGGYVPGLGVNPLPLGWNLDPTSNPSTGAAANITSFSITSNVVTFIAPNNFVAGQQVFINGLSVGTYLNGQVLVVLSAGLTSTQFEANFTHTNVGTTTDAGTASPISVNGQLLVSPVFGNSYYIENTTTRLQPLLGGIFQSAYQDAYQQPILNAGGLPTLYSVRVTARIPSGNTAGNLLIRLINYTNSGFGAVYGSFTIPFSSMTTNMVTYTGTLLTTAFTTVPSGCVIWYGASEIGPNADLEVDRIEVFPTLIPVESTVVYGSYVGLPEAVDGVSGRVVCENENTQPVVGGSVLYNALVLQKTSSKYRLQSSPNQEPADWGEPTSSARTGSAGIYAYTVTQDQGEQWELSASRAGAYLYEGGQPHKITQEIFQIWDAINWAAGNSIWTALDINDRKIYLGVPLPTPNFWLPNAPPAAPSPVIQSVQISFVGARVPSTLLITFQSLPSLAVGQVFTFSGLTNYPALNGLSFAAVQINGNAATFLYGTGIASYSGTDTGIAELEGVPNLTSPNVILMCNYQGLDAGDQIGMSPGLHTTMFGKLAALDMKRKWSIWQIASPFAGFVPRNSLDAELMICNGIGSSKIYTLNPDADGFDDGTPFTSLYTTYGFVNSSKGQENPMLGLWRKRYKMIQFMAPNSQTINVNIYPNILLGPNNTIFPGVQAPTNVAANYFPYSIAGGFPPNSGEQDHWCPINFPAQRAFVEFSITGGSFALSKMLLAGTKDAWTEIVPNR